MGYSLGNYNVICDKCGMKRLDSECRLDWQGLFVCYGCYDPRHPQDFVKSIPEDQSVPIPRPDVTQSVGTTTLVSSAVKYATSITVSSASGLLAEDSIGILLDTYDATATGLIQKIQWTNISSISGTTITLRSSLWAAASSGNTVYLPSVNNETYVTATTISATEL